MLVHFNVPGGGDTNAGAWLISFGGHGVLVANRRTGHSLTERPSPADDHKQVRGDLDTKQRPDKGLRASSSGLSTLFSGSYTNCTTWRMGLSFDDHGFIDGPDQRVQKGRTCRQPRNPWLCLSRATSMLRPHCVTVKRQGSMGKAEPTLSSRVLMMIATPTLTSWEKGSLEWQQSQR